jgi:nitrous oxidase accessory protein
MSRVIGFLLGIIILLFTPIEINSADNELQQLINETPENGVLELEGKTYEGNIVITKPITIKGQKNTVIKGEQKGNVVEVKASNVRVENLTVMNSEMDRNSGEEYAAIKIFEDNNTITNVIVKDSFHGIYLSQAHGNEISNVTVYGLQNGEIGGQGNGIHLYYSNQNILANNQIVGTRDGIFFDYSNENQILQNDISHTRYGLHFMYSNQNMFNENSFTFNTAGAAIMFSYENTLMNNEFSLSQGMRSFGLLLQASDDNLIKDNLFIQNLRGIYMDQSNQNRLEENIIMKNQIGVEIWSSSAGQIFTKNTFDHNITNVLALGGEGNNAWSENGIGNNWSNSFPLLDLDQNGIGDHPVSATSSLYSLVEEQELTLLFLKSPSIQIYEKMNEVLNQDKVMFQDDYPIVAEKIKFSSAFAGIILSVLGFVGIYVALAKRRDRT